jgi:hypothetical protein
MSLTLALLREDLRDHLGTDSTDLPDAAADRLLNRSWWPLAAQLRFNEKDAEHTFTTVSGTEAYAFPTDSDAIERVVIQDSGQSEWIPLTKIDDWTMLGKEDDDEDGLPMYYSRRGAEFIFFPIPDDEYDVRVKYQRTLVDIESSGPGVPQEWHEVILWGAVSRGFFALGDWTRGKDAQAQQAMFIQSLSTQEERESFDRPTAGVRVLKRRYP